jgi:DNA-binding Lrp family transcriptional regulator
MGLSDALGADYGDFEVAPRSAALPEDVADFVDVDVGSGSASAAAYGDAGDGHDGKVKDKSKKSARSNKSTRAGAGGGEEDDGASGGGGEKEGGDGGVGLRKRLLELLESHPRGLASRTLAKRLEVSPEVLGKVMVGLIDEGRVDPMKTRNADGAEVQVFVAVKPERAEKLRGLGEEDKAVLAIVERSGGTGVWIRTIKNQTKVQQAALIKILKRLEGRKLIKPITSIAFKHRKMFMGYDIGEHAGGGCGGKGCRARGAGVLRRPATTASGRTGVQWPAALRPTRQQSRTGP